MRSRSLPPVATSLNVLKLLGVLLALSLGLIAPVHAAVTRGPYLQLATEDSVIVVWRSDVATHPVVRYGMSPDNLDQTEAKDFALKIGAGVEIADPRLRYARLHSADAGTRQYEMRLSGLRLDTRYYYAIYDGDEKLAGGDENYFFRTHPAIGTDAPIRIWAVGDSGRGNEVQNGVYLGALKAMAEENKPLNIYLHVGDMAYTHGQEDEFQKGFFDMYQSTLRHAVCWPAMGNHEGHTSDGLRQTGPYYDAYVSPAFAEAGGVVSGTEAYYSFDYGRAHFICLNSYDVDRSADAEMAQWLEEDLHATDADWLIAFFHHPPYTKGSHDSDLEIELIEMREQIMPILEEHGVDMVLTGHSHIYERSMLIDGAYHTPTTADGVVLDDGDGYIHGDGAYHKSEGLHAHEGVAQLVIGHGGTSLRRKGAMPIMRRVQVEHGSMLIDIEGDTLTSRMINSAGETTDTFHIVKRGRANPQIVENPWTPVGPTVQPAGGEVVGAFELKLTPAKFWRDGAIHYTLDGSEPTRESPRYDGPVSLDALQSPMSVRTRSYKGPDVDPSLETVVVLYPEGGSPAKKIKKPAEPPAKI